MAFKVRAIERGFLGKLREPGDEFSIPGPVVFSHRWMESLDKELDVALVELEAERVAAKAEDILAAEAAKKAAAEARANYRAAAGKKAKPELAKV